MGKTSFISTGDLTTGTRILGTGTTGYRQTVEYLKRQNYTGWLILENLYELEPMRDLNEDYFAIMNADIAVLKESVR